MKKETKKASAKRVVLTEEQLLEKVLARARYKELYGVINLAYLRDYKAGYIQEDQVNLQLFSRIDEVAKEKKHGDFIAVFKLDSIKKLSVGLE